MIPGVGVTPVMWVDTCNVGVTPVAIYPIVYVIDPKVSFWAPLGGFYSLREL